MILYYITDRTQFAGTEAERRTALLRCVAEAATANIDFIQLREKDLSPSELERFGKDVLRTVHERSETTRLLINSRSDIALAIGADGVHLTSTDIGASEARAVRASSAREQSLPGEFLVATSCHSVDDVRRAESHGANFVVLGPVFEKSGTSERSLGIDAIRVATREQARDDRVEAGDNRVGVPVLALGGVTLANARLCMEAGAAGLAGIRLFQEGNLKERVRILREAT
jgi:thiamine-phosphate pyrophosphorylase